MRPLQGPGPHSGQTRREAAAQRPVLQTGPGERPRVLPKRQKANLGRPRAARLPQKQPDPVRRRVPHRPHRGAGARPFFVSR